MARMAPAILLIDPVIHDLLTGTIPNMNADDLSWMTRAIELAERGRGAVEPNPLVGAVVVRDGVVVGEGWHERFGGPHAEVNAQRLAGEAARGATLYVTLEPCCHHGKTPPCTDAVIAAGISRVVAAMQDPFPQVAGRGRSLLEAAGIAVECGIGEELARRQNAPYLTLLGKQRPYVHGKWAMSLDGKIATTTGESKWISGEHSRAIVHTLRGRMDGILVGIGTALADDPLLTARPAGPRTATRVVLDRRARLPLGSHLVRTASQTPTMVVVGPNADASALAMAGCEIVVAEDVATLLAELGRRRWTNLMVEGGAAVLASFTDYLDEAHVFVAPKLIGGREAPGPLGGVGVARIADVARWSRLSCEPSGEDVYLRATR